MPAPIAAGSDQEFAQVGQIAVANLIVRFGRGKRGDLLKAAGSYAVAEYAYQNYVKGYMNSGGIGFNETADDTGLGTGVNAEKALNRVIGAGIPVWVIGRFTNFYNGTMMDIVLDIGGGSILNSLYTAT